MGRFTNEEVEQLTDLYYKNLSFGEIGRQLGRSRQVIGQKVKLLGLTREVVNISCEFCSKEFERLFKNGEVKRFCSENCKHGARRKRNSKPPSIKPCVNCNQSFEARSSTHTICSYECRTEYKRKEYNKQRRLKRCVYCNKWHSINRIYCSDECSRRNMRRNSSIAKSDRMNKARQNGQFDADIDIYRLIERDGEECYLCGDALSFDCHYNNPKYPTIEHVLAIKNGGTHSWDNTKVACRDCNTKKGIKLI